MKDRYEKDWNTLSEIGDTLGTIRAHFNVMVEQITYLSQLDGPAVGVTDLTKEGSRELYLTHLEKTLEEVREVLPKQVEAIIGQLGRLEIAVRNSVDEAIRGEMRMRRVC